MKVETKRPLSALLKQVWITEKASRIVPLRQYIFIVSENATKPEIKKAVEMSYGVAVESVNIIRAKGKQKRLGRSVGKTSEFKKACVKLAEGDKIDIIPT